MKGRIVIAIIFLFGFTGFAGAQDTTLPVMSQHAYDSTLRALKRASEAKQKDTVKKNVTITPAHDTTVPKVPVKGESEKPVMAATPTDTIKADTNKKHRKRYIPTGYIGLWIGEAYPEGDFLGKAFPHKGGCFSLTATFPGMVSRFGIIFKIDDGFNGVDQLAYTGSLKDAINDQELAMAMDDGYKYTYKTLLMGLYYTYPFGKFSIDGRFLCGAMAATIPGVTVSIIDYGNNYNQLVYKTYNADGRAFAVDEGLTVRYLAMPWLSVMLSVDNLSASPSFTIVSNGLNDNVYGNIEESPATQNTITQSIHVLTASFGVGYTIRPKKQVRIKK